MKIEIRGICQDEMKNFSYCVRGALICNSIWQRFKIRMTEVETSGSFFLKAIEVMRAANTVENSAFTSGIVCVDQSSIQQFYYFIRFF